MKSETRKPFVNRSLAIKSLRIAAFVLVLFVAAQKGYAQGRVEDDVRRKVEEKKDIARRQEAAERARIESAKTTGKLNETRSLNKTELRDQAKLKEASEKLKKSGMKETAEGGKKATEAGNPTTSGDGGRSRGRVPTKSK